jgi:hypothetical protein
MTADAFLQPASSFEESDWDDITSIARRAGIEYRTMIDRAFRRRFETLVTEAGGGGGEPLFHLLVPLRFLAARQRSACRFQFTVGKRRLCDDGIQVNVEFVGGAEQGYWLLIRGGLERASANAVGAGLLARGWPLTITCL